MRVLVVGGEGYLGRHVVQELRERQHTVSVMDCLLWEGQQAAPETIQLCAGTVSANKLIEQGLWDTVVYLGAIAHDPDGKLGAREQGEFNYSYPILCARACREARARFIFVSSMSVFAKGVNAGGAGIEDYPNQKLAVEQWLFSYMKPSQFSILRFGTLYGPPCGGLDSYREHLLLNSMCLAAARGGPIIVRGGEQVRPVYSVDEAAVDVVDVVLAGAEEAGGAVQNHYGNCARVRDFALAVNDYFGVSISEEATKDSRSYGVAYRTPVEPYFLAGLAGWSRENKDKIVAKRYKDAASV